MLEDSRKEVEKHKKQLEEGTRTLRDLSAKFKETQRMEELALARKTKELETVLREKKCRSFLCVEDIKIKNVGDASQLASTITTLNDKLVEKAYQVSKLEESVIQSNHLITQVCNQN